MYRKPTHTGLYLHLKLTHPYHVKRGVVHSLISRGKVIRQGQKDFNNKIKNISHDLRVNDYSQEFVHSVIKSSTRNRPSSDKIYQGIVLRVYQRNSHALGTVSKTKHTLPGTLLKNGPIKNAQQTNQCEYSIPCDCGR
jgi:hypothetical protein